MVTTKNITEHLRVVGNFPIQHIHGSIGEKFFWLCKKQHIQLSDGREITIPFGFEFDLASIPRFLWSMIPPFDDALYAYMIHDYLYIRKPFGFSEQERLIADREMLIWMEVLNGPEFLNKIKFFFCQKLGKKVWQRGIRNKSHLRYP